MRKYVNLIFVEKFRTNNSKGGEKRYMEYIMICMGIVVALTCILILENIEYRRRENEERKSI